MTWDTLATIWSVPAIHLAAGLLAAARRRYAWPVAQGGALLALAAATFVAAQAAWLGTTGRGPVDGPDTVVTWLVAFLGWVIVAYSRRYLAGEPGQQRYVVSLLTTLAAVGCVVATRHLGVLLLAWVASSLSLHGLLTFYRERRSASLVAYKKFLASRLAEACLAVALVLLHRAAGTLDLDTLLAWASQRESLPAGVHLAMVLVAAAALVKCAQLPVHGWLIQVMEAPTPVSALLHAGVVNIAGLVLIRLGPLLEATPVAQGLLVAVGGTSAVFASLVAATRVSIKVRLAWSTCAQMGFMLVECALGLYDLALLHLVAHSLYKAHAFLNAGETATVAQRYSLHPAAAVDASRSLLRRFVALPVACVFVASTAWAAGQLVPDIDVPWIAAWLLALGLATLSWHDRSWLRGAARVVALTLVYLGVHAAFARVVPGAAVSVVPSVVVAAGFLGLYVLQAWLSVAPGGPLARTVHRWAFAGLYLDERYTRLALECWPTPWPPHPRRTAGSRLQEQSR